MLRLPKQDKAIVRKFNMENYEKYVEKRFRKIQSI